MSDPSLNRLWLEFLARWPVESVREMTLAEYTNTERNDSFTYWVEFKLDSLGSIRGGSAFKLGIYRRDSTTPTAPARGRVWGDEYAWQAKYGQTEKEAFAEVRTRLIAVIDAAQSGNFERIDEIDLSPVLKWKVAFLYQNRAQPGIFPVYQRDALVYLYRTIVPGARRNTTPYSSMYATLFRPHAGVGDVFDVAATLWAQWQAAEKDGPARVWAIPIAWLTADAIARLTERKQIGPEDIDAFLASTLNGVELVVGDRLVLLVDDRVRAVGTLTCADQEEYAWDQEPMDVSSELVVSPSAIRLLEPGEWDRIREQIESRQQPLQADEVWQVVVQDAADFRALRGDSVVGLRGLNWIHDLTGISREDFIAKSREWKGDEPYWRFASEIQVGDPVAVVAAATHELLGWGVVTGRYEFTPGETFAHRRAVRWTSDGPTGTVPAAFTKPKVRRVERAKLVARVAAPAASATAELPASVPAPVVVAPVVPAKPCIPQNIILYGPPGTGKTYSTIKRALELILGPGRIEGQDEKGLATLFRDHQANGQIEFVTFHQAYGYEEFVEGLRPVLDSEDTQNVRYELHPGIFKRIAIRAAAEGLPAPVVPVPVTAVELFDVAWDAALAFVRDEESVVLQAQAGGKYQLEATARGSLVVKRVETDEHGEITQSTGKRQTASREGARLLWDARAQLGPVDTWSYKATEQVFVTARGIGGGHHYTAYWVAFKLMEQLRRPVLAMAPVPVPTTPAEVRVQQTLDKSSSGNTSFAFTAATRQYVLIIDEINRGNVSRILGELITLLEPDKRLGQPGELKLPLSYSPKHRFAVPPNLHVIGTMNTADRSIALMDVALRRRFTFEELMPRPAIVEEVLKQKVPIVPSAVIALVVDVFNTLNARIRFLYDRDHQLGHAYFLGISSLESLRRVFVDRVIPLLQEYFYGAWDKVCMVLGCPYDEDGSPKRGGHLVKMEGNSKLYVAPMVRASVFEEQKTIGFDHEEYEDRVDYALSNGFSGGNIAPDKLARTFLDLLQLDSAVHDERLAALTSDGV